MLSLRIPALAALALLICSAAAAAQSAPLNIDTRRLTLGSDSLAIFIVRGADTVQTGWMRDLLSADEENGRPVLRRVYVSADRILGMRVDTIVDARESLAPIRLRDHSARGGAFLDFSAGQVTGWMQLASGDSVAVQSVLPAEVYNSSSFDLVLRAADLSQNWRAEIPAFLPSTRSVVQLQAQVEGAETVGGRTCWRVQANFAGTPVTFWIDQESRALCKQVMVLGPGVQLMLAPVPAASAPSRQAT